MNTTDSLWLRVPNGCDEWSLSGTDLVLRELRKGPRSKALHEARIEGRLLHYISGCTLGEAMRKAAQLAQ